MFVFVSGLILGANQHAASLDACLLLFWLAPVFFFCSRRPFFLLLCLFVPLLVVSGSAARGGEALFPHVSTTTAREQRETHKTAVESQ